MTEPQAWVLIGTFTTAIFGMMALLTASTNRVIRAEIGGLRGELSAEIGGLRGELSAEIGGLRGEFGAEIGGLRGEFGAEIGGLRGELIASEARLANKIDALDRDVQAIARHVFGEPT